MKRLFLALILCLSILSITGCVKYVNVPVWICPEPVIPDRQPLHVPMLLPNATDEDIIKSMAADILILDGYADQLHEILLGYTK